MSPAEIGSEHSLWSQSWPPKKTHSFRISDWQTVWPDGWISFRYLATHNNSNFIKIAKVGYKFVKHKINPQKFAMISESLPKWRNFAKFSHTADKRVRLEGGIHFL